MGFDYRILLLVASALLASCGSSGTPRGTAAIMGDRTISQRTVDQYTAYAQSFYTSDSGPVANCGPASPRCAVLRRQVLARLLEEAVVRDYARRRHIVLDGMDRLTLQSNLEQLQLASTPASHLLSRHVISLSFLRRLVGTEILVRKVEDQVTGGSNLSGFQYHIVLYRIPALGDPHHGPVYHQALTLAVDGRPEPAGTVRRHLWVVPHRLIHRMRLALALASPGEYVGPFRHGNIYLVAQLRGSGLHRLGRPARIAQETAIFRRWIAQQLRLQAPRCYHLDGHLSPCPSQKY